MHCIAGSSGDMQYTLRIMKKKKHQSEEKNPRGRFEKEEEGGGEKIKCSTKHCGSCCGGYVADCVAVCCCPCAVLHCCAMAIVKGPSLVGRKCLGLGKKNKNKNTKKKGCEDDVVVVVVERNKNNNIERVQRAVREMDNITVNAGFDAEKVWKELYQIGHMDFGRVSSSSHDD